MTKQSDSNNNVSDAKKNTKEISNKSQEIKLLCVWVSIVSTLVSAIAAHNIVPDVTFVTSMLIWTTAVATALVLFPLMEYVFQSIISFIISEEFTVQNCFKHVASTVNKQPFNCFGWVVLFPEHIRCNLVDLWKRWVRERGRLYAFFQMCLYLIKMVNIPASSILLQAFRSKRS